MGGFLFVENYEYSNIASILKIHKRKCLERIGLKELRGFRGLKNNTIITMGA